MEIYNEEINDLFAVENQKLQIHESLEVFSTIKTLKFFPSSFFRICKTTDFLVF